MLQVRRNPVLDTALERALVGMWVDVTNAGGAVGFTAPVEETTVRPVAEGAFARVRARLDDLVVAFLDEVPAGFGFLATNQTDLLGHWGTVKRLQRRPDLPGTGIGGALLDALEDAARERGLQRVTLTTRGGTGVEAFYLKRGYGIDGRLPGRLHLGGGVVTDELHLSKWVGAPEDAPAAEQLRIQRLDPGLPLPRFAHPGDAGLDLHAREDVTLAPGQRALVGTGVAIALPAGHVGLVHPRSGLAVRHGVGIVNAPGTIDEGYRGEVCVVLVNLDPAEAVTLRRGERIAQLVVQPVARPQVVEVDALPPSARGDGGFGSTGR